MSATSQKSSYVKNLDRDKKNTKNNNKQTKKKKETESKTNILLPPKKNKKNPRQTKTLVAQLKGSLDLFSSV